MAQAESQPLIFKDSESGLEGKLFSRKQLESFVDQFGRNVDCWESIVEVFNPTDNKTQLVEIVTGVTPGIKVQVKRNGQTYQEQLGYILSGMAPG